jgi:hypothetical protein
VCEPVKPVPPVTSTFTQHTPLPTGRADGRNLNHDGPTALRYD